MTTSPVRGAALSRALLPATLAYGTLEVLARVMQALAIFALAFWYPKSQFGAFYSYFAAYQLVPVICTGGLLESFMSRLAVCAGEPARQRALGAFYTRIFLRRAIVTLALGTLAAVALRAGGVMIDVVAVSAALVAGGLFGLVTLVSSYLTCAGQNRYAIVIRSFYNVAAYGCAVSVAIVGGRILDFFLGLAAAGFVSAWAIHIRARRSQGAPVDLAGFAPPRGSSWFLIPTLLNWFFWYGLVVCVSAWFGAQRAAEVAFANNIASALLIVNAAITQAWLSHYLARASASKAAAEAASRRVFRRQSFLMLAVTLLILIAYEVLLRLGFPLVVKYAMLGGEMSVLLFAISISSCYFGAINSYAINDAGRELASVSIAAYAVAIVVLAGAVAIAGILGVYIGLGALFVLRGFWITVVARRRFGAGFIDPPLIALNLCAFLCAAAYFIRQ